MKCRQQNPRNRSDVMKYIVKTQVYSGGIIEEHEVVHHDSQNQENGG